VRLELARALREAKKPQEALKQLNEASKELASQPASPSMFGGGSPASGMRMQLAMEYDQLGRKDLANQQRRLAVPPQGAPGMGAPAWVAVCLQALVEPCLQVARRKQFPFRLAHKALGSPVKHPTRRRAQGLEHGAN
jgi:hypothetical protein